MRSDLHEGARLFNARAYWEAHEAWEGPWREASGDDRAYIQALILLAAALHKRWHHGSLTARNYHKAAAYLKRLPDVYDGVDLRLLAHDVWRSLDDSAEAPQLPVSAD